MVSYYSYGRLGNVLFMAANCIGYALKHGLEFSIPNISSHEFWNPVYVTHLHNPNWNPNLENVIINEKHFHYEEIEFKEEWRNRNIILNGYWQSPKYWVGFESKIIELFNYPWCLKEDVCSLQARFGDYLTIPGKHIIVDEKYIRSSMDLVKDKTGIKRYKIFSDDLNYFRQNFGHIYNFEYSTNKGIEEDLIEASCCHSNIGSSSTFAFWIAILNRNPENVVVFNKRWFQEGWKDDHGVVDTKDILMENWFTI